MGQITPAEIFIYKIMWIFTPVLVSVVGWFIIRNVSRIEKDIDTNTADIKNLDHRLTQVETEHCLYHKK